VPFLALALLLAFQATDAQRAKVAWVPNPRAVSGGWVTDPSHHLRPATVDSLNAIIGALEASTSAEIAVAVVDSTSGLEPFDFALALHRVWGVGKQGKDNGVVLLWVPAQRAIQISVGYGLEGAIPDRRAGRIRDEALIPAFRDGRFDEGMIAGVRALAEAAAAETDQRQGMTPRLRTGGDAGTGPARRGGAGPIVRLVEWLGGGLASVAALFGGIFGVARWRRRRPRTCSKGHPMRLLGEQEDDARLSGGARLEENLKSVDWDVWVCDTCGEVQRTPYKRFLSGYTDCPECKRRTVSTVTVTLVAATHAHGGKERVTAKCANCGWGQVTERSTPMLSDSSSSSGGGFSGGGGGGGGGGSFGGGSAGGGGAGGHY